MADIDGELYDFVHSPIDNDFGLDIQTIAENSKDRGRFSAWLNGNVSSIVSLLETVRDNGVSPAFFASYEITEGYNSSWGWLNHTTPQGNPTEDAISVTNWIKQTSQDMTQNPAWIDYANYNDFVPQSDKDFGNQDFANMASGTIGRVVIAGTAAATWEVYYPKGLLAEYNGVQDYGAPLTKMKDLILQWGGTFNGDSDGGDGGDGGSNGVSKTEVKAIINNHRDLIDYDYTIDFGDFVEKVLNDMKALFNNNLSKISENFFRNRYFKITKTYKNLLSLHPNKTLFQVIEDIINDHLDEITVTVDDNIDQVFNQMINDIDDLDFGSDNGSGDGDGDGDEGGSSGERYFPVNYDRGGVNFFKFSNWEGQWGTIQLEMLYGWTRNSGSRFHAGYDVGGGGSRHPIHAVEDGTIERVDYQDLSGTFIIINHTHDDYYSLYQHLQNGSELVSEGDTVNAGDQIATMGGSGGNYAIHLHFELSKTNDFWNESGTVNPESYLGITGDNTTSLPNP